MSPTPISDLTLFSKGITATPSEVPTFAAAAILSTPTRQPLIEARGARACPEFGNSPSLQLLMDEMEWMTDRETLLNSNAMPAQPYFSFPTAGLNWLISTDSYLYGPSRSNRIWNAVSPGITVAAAYGSPAPTYGTEQDMLMPTHECLASLCRDDVGVQFFREYLYIHRSRIITRPGAFAREGGILWELAELERIHAVAMDRAFCQKYATPLARPEELMTRHGHPLTLLYNNGAPRHPSFVSGHAACAGAAAAYLVANMQLNDAQKAEVISLAELTFLGRWSAGIHWLVDGVAGLRGGWEIARPLLGADPGANPWEAKFQAMQNH